MKNSPTKSPKTNAIRTRTAAKRESKSTQRIPNQQKTKFRLLALANNPQIHQFFNDFLQGYAYRFAEKQNLAEYCLPLKFGGFYQQNQAKSHKFQELGNATFDLDTQQTVIRLNQCYLLNKLGYEHYFTSPELYLDINFASLTETISHELSHYIQYIKYEQSSCESSGAKDINGNFLYPSLVKEHTQFTTEIKEMIVNSAEYKKLKKWWHNSEVY